MYIYTIKIYIFLTKNQTIFDSCGRGKKQILTQHVKSTTEVTVITLA